MRRWIFATVVLGVVAATMLVARRRSDLPDEALYALQYPEVNAARTLMLTRSDSVRAWSAALTRAQSLALAATATRGPQPFLLETRGIVSPGTRAAFSRILEAELARIGTPRVPIRVLLASDTAASYSNYAGWYLRPTTAGDPCVVIIRLRESQTATFAPRTGDQRLGVCALYARHGMPGAGIAAWLDSTRAISAAGDSASVGSGDRTSYPGVSRIAGGMLLQALAPAACVAGRDEACVTATLHPRFEEPRRVIIDIARSPKMSSVYPYEITDYPGNMTASLRASMGPESFQRWWQSSLPPAEAYEQISGEPFALWARRYMEGFIGKRNPGPLRAEFPLVLGLLLAVVMAWWGIRGARRARS